MTEPKEQKALDAIADTVLKYQPKAKSKPAVQRKRLNPDGKKFGKRKLRLTTVSAFKNLARGYRHHFEMSPQVQEAQ